MLMRPNLSIFIDKDIYLDEQIDLSEHLFWQMRQISLIIKLGIGATPRESAIHTYNHQVNFIDAVDALRATLKSTSFYSEFADSNFVNGRQAAIDALRRIYQIRREGLDDDWLALLPAINDLKIAAKLLTRFSMSHRGPRIQFQRDQRIRSEQREVQQTEEPVRVNLECQPVTLKQPDETFEDWIVTPKNIQAAYKTSASTVSRWGDWLPDKFDAKHRYATEVDGAVNSQSGLHKKKVKAWAQVCNPGQKMQRKRSV